LHREKEKKRAAMKLLTDNTTPPSRRLVPQTTLGKWLWVLGCILVLVPLVMVGLLLTAVAVVAVLVMGLLSLAVIVVRRFGKRPATDAAPASMRPPQTWMGGDGRRNVRVVQNTNLDG
jgi:hypothetical protein